LNGEPETSWYGFPFLLLIIDEDASRVANDDRYRSGVSFDHPSVLFELDRLLRYATLAAIIEAETTGRTAVVYSFCDKHRHPDASSPEGRSAVPDDLVRPAGGC
jgi:hypothetical protein